MLLTNRLLAAVNRDGFGLAMLARERENSFQPILAACQTRFSVRHRDNRRRSPNFFGSRSLYANEKQCFLKSRLDNFI